MRVITILFCIIIPSLLQAQTISGTAKNQETDEGLPYASVLLYGTNIGSLTDENGYFELNVSQQKETDSLIIQYIGYQPAILAIKDVQPGEPIYLQPRDNQIKEVVVTPIDADSIMQIVAKRFGENHFRLNQKQLGFSRSFYYNSGELFEIAETSYEVLYEQNGNDYERNVRALQSRMVIDSAVYKSMNNIFNFKKDTLIVEPIAFLNMGQTFDSGENNDSRKVTQVYTFIDEYQHQGRDVYEILRQSYRKDDLFMEMTYLIDKETYGIFSRTFTTTNEEVINSLTPFGVRALLSVFGYKFRINRIDGFIYNRYNNEFFELDKGSYIFKADVARGGDWVNGTLNQEFYLQGTIPNQATEKEKGLSRSEIVYSFLPDYFSTFHLSTTDKTKEKIKSIQEKNALFDEEDFQSDRFRKWIKKGKKPVKEGVEVTID